MEIVSAKEDKNDAFFLISACLGKNAGVIVGKIRAESSAAEYLYIFPDTGKAFTKR